MTPAVIVKIGRDKYQTEVLIDKHQIIVDEPEDIGGHDLGPTPMSLLLSSLGTCKAITMRMYADQKNWALEKIEINLDIDIVKNGIEQLTHITIGVKLFGELDDLQRERILKVAEKCPVQKILSNPIYIKTHIVQ
ncbi:OsmC family protein [Sphingobacterium rhinopitheci]|uniref:OsmC family protein n=1 Tax=Sphingobacterium rhinopitheci TaxID=2781960 RepID=UPI001F51EE60|nr:OsmC family protein [Sphingobacterium rhinopitheci]MCI0919899.1 OsmC family protein [Sphingobacterium rhinopitheci]